ncbi:MAG: hypothetical protein RSE93_00690 [Oscillospiraceae bacterium]
MDMFDNLFDRAKEVYDAASKKTCEVYETSKLKLEIVNLNNEIKKLYEKLGSCVYSMVKADYENQDVLDSITEEIDDCKIRINYLQKKLGEMKNFIICENCGAKNSQDNFYCKNCGTRIKSEFSDEYAEQQQQSDDCVGDEQENDNFFEE